MCEYCQKEKVIIEKEFIDGWMIGWGDCKITKENVEYSNHIIFIDRGFLRFALADDCQCMDHGQKIKIKFCPMCGVELEGVE